MSTRQLLDYQCPLTKMNSSTIKELTEEFMKHSREYHNPREDVTRGKGTRERGNENLAEIMAKIKNMHQQMKKMDQYIHVIRVGCDNFNRPHLTKD